MEQIKNDTPWYYQTHELKNKYPQEPVKKYKMDKEELEKYLNKFNNTQTIAQLKASPFLK